MPTKIYKFDGSLLTTVADSTLNASSSSIRIPGSYYENYGQAVMEDIVWVMQNFAGMVEPPFPIVGQTWFDTSKKVMKTWDGSSWLSTGSILVDDTNPGNGENVGDLWYDTTNKQLNIWNGSNWDIVGPLGSAVNQDPISNSIIPNHSKFESIRLSDGVNSHQVWRWTIGGIVVLILSLDSTFTPAPVITGFSVINPGLNFNSSIPNIGIGGDPTLMKNNQTNLPTVDNSFDLGATNRVFRNIYANYALIRSGIGINVNPGSHALNVSGTVNVLGNSTMTGSVGVTGAVNITGGLAVTGTGSFTSTVTLGAGTATIQPLKFTSGSLTTATVLGSVEFDGSGLFFTQNFNGTPTRKTILTSGNVVIANNGDSATEPGLTWQGSRDTGFFNPANGVIALTTTGTEKIRVNGNGAIGIGGSNFGSSGQVLTSNGSGSPVEWANTMPPGVLMPYAGSGAPAGWLLCHGQSLSTTTYADLFAAIGYTYGGSGASFDLPDLRGRTVAGRDNMGGAAAGRITNTNGVVGNTLGSAGGEQTHQLTIPEMPAHSHTFGLDRDDYNGAGGAAAVDQIFSAGNDRATTSVGGDGAHNNLQPTIILNYIIKT
jgi:microcystin-dependent protein